ncbi:MAG: DUF2784 domain-containing protein [Deferrisomatales bacterium]
MRESLADAVVVLHLGWIAFLVLGAVPGRRVRWVRRLHLAALGFALTLTAAGWICPLTHLEVWLRGRHGYAGTFVGHYAARLVYPEVSRGLVLAGAVLVTVLSLLVYYGRPERGAER